MRRTAVALALALLAVSDAQASPSLEHILSMGGEDAILVDTDWDVVVARVRKSTGNATNGNPPRLELKVLEVLRGGARVDRHRAIWVPFPNNIDWVGGGSDALIASWEAESLAAPPVGSKWILAGEMRRDSAGFVFDVSPIGRFPFDERRSVWVREALEHGPELRAEAREFAGAWPRRFSTAELLDGARAVLPSTPLAPGQPILFVSGPFWQGRVVRTNTDGTIVVRPEGQDSRWDKTARREQLRQYPERLLQEARTSPSSK
jgi:hypothetical protein